MRRLVLLCLAVSCASAYQLVIQKIQLNGTKISDGSVSCDAVASFSVEGKNHNTSCYLTTTPGEAATDPPTVVAVNLLYTDTAIITSSKKVNIEIGLKAGTKVAFTMEPKMKAGEQQKLAGAGKFVPIATTPAAPTKKAEQTTMATAPEETTPGPGQVLARKLHVPRADAADAAASAAEPSDSAPSLALRLRGAGPARMPAPTEAPQDEENRRVKRQDATDPPPVTPDEIHVEAMIYVLDEGGNPSAVWAAVIEGIILLLLVGACCWFFFIAPRRQMAAAASQPYKPDGPTNYSVSYDNSGYNQNQRIDAFQNPPPAPSRPANSSYMDDYITDSVGAMSRPAASVQQLQPTSAMAVNPAVSNFQPSHQRFDSSGLVTVNLS